MLEAMRFKENTVFNRLDYIVQSDNQDSLIVIFIHVGNLNNDKINI